MQAIESVLSIEHITRHFQRGSRCDLPLTCVLATAWLHIVSAELQQHTVSQQNRNTHWCLC